MSKPPLPHIVARSSDAAAIEDGHMRWIIYKEVDGEIGWHEQGGRLKQFATKDAAELIAAILSNGGRKKGHYLVQPWPSCVILDEEEAELNRSRIQLMCAEDHQGRVQCTLPFHLHRVVCLQLGDLRSLIPRILQPAQTTAVCSHAAEMHVIRVPRIQDVRAIARAA